MMLWPILTLAALTAAPTAPAESVKPIPRAQFIAEMDGQFRTMDADKNGQLDRAEIEQHQKLSTVAEAKARNQALFVQLDIDKNGRLSTAEFAKLAAPPAVANEQPILAREDGNRDGLVSLVEHRAATLANFDRLDVDRNGVVTGPEMKAGGIR